MLEKHYILNRKGLSIDISPLCEVQDRETILEFLKPDIKMASIVERAMYEAAILAAYTNKTPCELLKSSTEELSDDVRSFILISNNDTSRTKEMGAEYSLYSYESTEDMKEHFKAKNGI